MLQSHGRTPLAETEFPSRHAIANLLKHTVITSLCFETRRDSVDRARCVVHSRFLRLTLAHYISIFESTNRDH